MKAVIYEKYGDADVLNLTDIEKPVPKKDEILIKIIATSVSAADWRLRKADPFLARLFNGLFKPRRIKVLGYELAGIVEEGGSDVREFNVGDPVFAYCMLKFGGYAEYTCLKETDIISLKPENMSFEEAATTPLGALTAFSLLKKAKVTSGQKILIYGASGSVGTYAIQFAKYFGAEVTSVCSSKNIELVKSLGSDYTVDYTQTEITSLNATFDIVFDAVGKISKSTIRKIISQNGKFVTVKSQTKPSKRELQFVKELIESRNLISVIDKTYKLKDIRAAHMYVEQFRKRGNVAVLVQEGLI
ncbi:NAD(P)-dependent alcohol dehydrogenase [uncultured Fluviicola sp.]|uniref:NAD(P)-dependent alcohol dehydrogenase n=1 Tax=uncultured Fluviicola sp. TaxID=463303 RepID=UPI0025DABD56|nr:NAD(P)-dependent alcohol dehydrogenase [uncultured Fluviicola sp.]